MTGVVFTGIVQLDLIGKELCIDHTLWRGGEKRWNQSVGIEMVMRAYIQCRALQIQVEVGSWWCGVQTSFSTVTRKIRRYSNGVLPLP